MIAVAVVHKYLWNLYALIVFVFWKLIILFSLVLQCFSIPNFFSASYVNMFIS